MTVMTRKNTGSRAKQRALDSASQAKQRAVDTASQVVPMAKNAVPMAKNAVPMAKNVGLAAKQSAGDAVAWATPRVMEARSWAAPYVEQAGVAVSDKIGPAISEKIAPAIGSALIETAHRLDVTPPQRKRWPRVVAGFAMVAAVGSAVAAVVLRRRPDLAPFGAPDQAPADAAAPVPGDGSAAPATATDEESVNGRQARTT